MDTWQLQEAKAKLSALIQMCNKKGPQEITVRGEVQAVVISREMYDSLTKPKEKLLDILLSSPVKIDLDIKRSQEIAREIDL